LSGLTADTDGGPPVATPFFPVLSGLSPEFRPKRQKIPKKVDKPEMVWYFIGYKIFEKVAKQKVLLISIGSI
jgi:hypothetical protein